MSSMRTRKLNLTFRDEPDEIPLSDEEGGIGAETIPPPATAPQTSTDTADTDANGAGEEEEEFTVEAILNKKTERGVTKYLIKWEGYDESYNTWEPLENLDCEEILEEFEKQWSKKHSYANKRKRQSQVAKSSTSKVDEFDSFFNEDDNTSTSIVGDSGIGAASTSSSQMPPKQKSLNLVMREEGKTYGLDREDHEPQLIVGTCTRDEEIIFIVLWKNKSTGEVETQGDLVPAKELWQKYPEFVLSYFENHKGWVPGWNEAESDADEENENDAEQAEVPNEVDSDEEENQDAEADETGTNKEDGDIDRDKEKMVEEEEAESN